MKLNLLPTYVSKASAAKTATVLAVLMAAIGIVGAVALIVFSTQERDRAANEAVALHPQYVEVNNTAKSADTIIASAQQLLVNIGLADAMMKHNSVYPDLYDEVRRYIPSFYRVYSMAATPNGPESCTVTMSGTLQTQQQYADLMLALLRIPGATNVSRAGYVPTDPRVPPLNEVDQIGTPIRPGEAQIPSDPQSRLEFFIGQGSVTGFEGVGGYGAGTDNTLRTAMPGWSNVNVAVVIARNIQVPDPRATLGTGGNNQQQPGGGGGGRGRGPI